MFHRKHAIERWYNFPPCLISVSALPSKTRNTEITSLHLDIVRCFANKHKTRAAERHCRMTNYELLLWLVEVRSYNIRHNRMLHEYPEVTRGQQSITFLWCDIAMSHHKHCDISSRPKYTLWVKKTDSCPQLHQISTDLHTFFTDGLRSKFATCLNVPPQKTTP